MQTDRQEYPSDWEEEIWLLHQLWYEDVDDWVKQRDWQMEVVTSFGDNCVDLLKELGKIDGSMSSHEINVFNKYERTYNMERWDTLSDQIRGMKIALCLGDKDTFIEQLISTFGLIEQNMRSDAVRQGELPLIYWSNFVSQDEGVQVLRLS